MTATPAIQRVLLVEAAGSTVAELPRLIENLHAKGMDVFTIAEAEAVGSLKQHTAAGEPVVVLIGPKVSNLAALAAEVQRHGADGQLIFLQGQDQVTNVRERLGHVPVAGLHWSVADIADASLADTVNTAALEARQRVRLRATLERANLEINASKAESRIGFRRLIISDRYLANFLAQTRDAIVAIDADYRVLYWSAGAEQLFGRDHPDVVGIAASELPFWSPELQGYLTKLRAGADTLSAECRCAAPGGEIAVEIVLSAVRDESSNFVGSSLVIRDVSARNKMLEVEREERAKAARKIDRERLHLRSLFEQAPGFIAVTTGPNHVFEVANDAYYQIIGHRPLLGKSVHDALPEMQGQEFLTLLDHVYSTGETYVGRGTSVSMQREPGAALETLFVDFVFQPIIEPDGSITGIFCQGSDITQQQLTQEKLALHQKHLEELVTERTSALEKSQRALQQSQKLEAIGQLTGGIAHDFNNVLQIITGNLQLLQLDIEGSVQTRKYLKSAVDAVDRGAKLSSQLLAFARRQPLQPMAVNLTRILRGMDDLLRRALGEDIEIETIVAGGLWNTMVDPHQLENVVLNLSINARDAMETGGKLTLELGNAMLDDQYVLTQTDVPAGQYVMLAISDTGHGMTPEVIERAFDPFFTTKREGEGTGLGLSMAYGFVKQSGGHIKIYSETGSGTTFKIYLPRSHQPEVDAPAALSGPVKGGTETILVVEDDLSVQETAVRILRDLGYRVLKASDGQSALNILQSGCSVDLLFTDVVMPGPVRSPDLARRAKQMFPDIAVLFTSGYTQNAIVHGGRLDPGVELLSKPYRREDLARKIQHVLANARQVSAEKPAFKIPDKDAVVVSQILVVEDNSESRVAVCELLTMLGYKAVGVACAEDAVEALETEKFDLLFTDVNLPGMSGLQLAKQALKNQPSLNVIIASGYGPAIEEELDFSAVVLSKPFDLNRLKDALESLG